MISTKPSRILFRILSLTIIITHLVSFCLRDAVLAAESSNSSTSSTSTSSPSSSSSSSSSSATPSSPPRVTAAANGKSRPKLSSLSMSYSSSSSVFGAGNPNIASLKSVQTDQFTGRATLSVPIEVVPGRKGIQPNLALTYASGSRAVNTLDPRVRQSQARNQQAQAKHALNSGKNDMIKVPVGRRSVSFFRLAGHEFLLNWEMGPGPGGKINTTNTIKDLSHWGTHIETQNAIASGSAQYTTAEVSASGLVDAMQWYEQSWVDTNTQYSGISYNSNNAVNTVIYAAGGNVPNCPGWNPAFSNAPSSVFYPYINRED